MAIWSSFCVHIVNNRSLVATIIILEQSFTLSQQGEQDVGKTLALAAGEYMTSQTQAVVEEAVNEVLYKDDGEDDKLSKMIIDIILKNCMCGCHLS
jgi:hypothetical protein